MLNSLMKNKGQKQMVATRKDIQPEEDGLVFKVKIGEEEVKKFGEVISSKITIHNSEKCCNPCDKSETCFVIFFALFCILVVILVGMFLWMERINRALDLFYLGL